MTHDEATPQPASRTTPRPRTRPAPPTSVSSLPDDHLALVVQDALAAVDARWGREANPVDDDLRSVHLYGWAIGALGARELAARSATDLGLRHLLGDRRPSFAELRQSREDHRAELEADFGVALAVCRGAGLSRLGRIALPQHAGTGAVAAYVTLARSYLDEADAADQRDDRETGAGARGDELPTHLAAHDHRLETFTRLAVEVPTVSPFPRRGHSVVRALASAVATLGLLLGGLLLIRWVGAANAEVNYTGQARVPVAAAPPAAPTASPTPVAAIASPTGNDLTAASQEGIRLGIMALATDDLKTARDYFFLAHEAVPESPIAADRYRQIETALGIESRTDDWEPAVEDLAELRRVAPGSPTLLSGYVTALVGAGREVLRGGEAPRAFELCTEATRWLPTRADAQACLATARQEVSVSPTQVRPSPTPRPATPTTPPSAGGAQPTATASGPQGQAGGPALQLALSGGCQAAGSGARSLQIEGTLSAGGEVAAGATVQVRIQDAEGRVIDNSTFPIASQRFTVQRTVAGGGPQTVTATATLAGYEPGESTLRVVC